MDNYMNIIKKDDFITKLRLLNINKTRLKLLEYMPFKEVKFYNNQDIGKVIAENIGLFLAEQLSFWLTNRDELLQYFKEHYYYKASSLSEDTIKKAEIIMNSKVDGIDVLKLYGKETFMDFINHSSDFIDTINKYSYDTPIDISELMRGIVAQKVNDILRDWYVYFRNCMSYMLIKTCEDKKRYKVYFDGSCFDCITTCDRKYNETRIEKLTIDCNGEYHVFNDVEISDIGVNGKEFQLYLQEKVIKFNMY